MRRRLQILKSIKNIIDENLRRIWHSELQIRNREKHDHETVCNVPTTKYIWTVNNKNVNKSNIKSNKFKNTNNIIQYWPQECWIEYVFFSLRFICHLWLRNSPDRRYTRIGFWVFTPFRFFRMLTGVTLKDVDSKIH